MRFNYSSNSLKKVLLNQVNQHGRIDFTPMVDLGFLLISFFIFTARLSEPVGMKLYMPNETGSPTPVKCSASLTIIPISDRLIAWYECQDIDKPNIQISNENEIRNVILEKQGTVKHKFGDQRDLVVIIKPARTSEYRLIVNILDEMTINGVTRYAISDLDESDKQLLSQTTLPSHYY